MSGQKVQGGRTGPADLASAGPNIQIILKL